VKTTRALFASLGLALMFSTAGCIVERRGEVVERVVPAPPPAVRYEAVPPPPGPVEVWVWQPGHWRWDGREYVWYPGRYAERPAHQAVWVQHQWVQRPTGWVFVEGHWR
jgi:hypothetical protein